MGLSSLPAPSEGMLCVLIVNTALSISIIKGLVRTILHLVGLRLSCLSPLLPASIDARSSESFEYRISPSESYIEQFRNQAPSIRFDAVCRGGHKREDRDCSVCLSEFMPESEISKLSCGHIFHRLCLEKWLDYWKITCPLCRKPMMVEEEASSPCFW
ncbi:probable E3 ubiquitin-protein ligase XERICO [Eucalyptus grandis]|uniref:RING-type domain-containing protein n=4 Tax=Eucalyptus TaxID=3932 RepID=A0A059A1G4_EUCGR|nr:probable E3 ubiquitin-protein ligase XERICO [Eucalyptus grandis]XP_039160749.1 probable E3 ubiquitin-protein ligase XERICO [Eucalyptus grandis]KAK3405136.1 hypothetical protein EUGRSUZ_K01389 [Eucalyptus grandis]KAK3405137.1 hypothetical protein EUGRSUZ_K01389 [Eucalyptus grandis]